MRIIFLMVLGMWGGILLATPSAVLAASNNTIIRTFVGDDTTPPSTPVMQSVIPITPTQINIVWSASTDDVFLIGYRLFRNGVQIATTTLTSFNDSGLSPETLYEYTTDAFDSFDNFSSSSVPLSTTTPALLVVPAATTTPTSTKATSGSMVVRLDSIEVVPSLRSVLLRWQTNADSRYTVRWGRTISYELGSISTNIFKQSHETTLENLEPGTHYWYTIEATTVHGSSRTLISSDFTTLPVFKSSTPPNVRNVTAVVSGPDVTLGWVNPVLPPGSRVRVMRSHLFYPLSPTDGALVYEGVGNVSVDSSALLYRSPQYYTLFVITKDGVVSSGAVIVARTLPLVTAVVPWSTTTTSPEPVIEEVGDVAVLHATDVLIRQGALTQVLSQPLQIISDQVYIIIIPVSAVSTHLKSIIVSVQDPTDQRVTATYLLKLNQTGDAYEAVIEASQVVGRSRLTIEVFDFNQASVRRISAPFVFVQAKSAVLVFPDDIVSFGQTYAWLFLVGSIGFCLAAWLILFRRRTSEDKS